MALPPTEPPSDFRLPAEVPYLDPIPFSSGLLLSGGTFHLVADFTCNKRGRPETQFEQDVSEWIRSDKPGGAMEATRLGLAEVRIFLHADGRVVGYAAIGLVEWRIAEQVTPVGLLHFFGVHTNFRDEKPTEYRRGYGRRILGGVLEEVNRRAKSKWFALYVAPDNPARGDPTTNKGFYPEFGFRELDEEEDEGRTWVRMIRPIGEPGT